MSDVAKLSSGKSREPPPLDLLVGARAMSDATEGALTPRQIFYLLENGRIPGAFKLGRRGWAVRRSTWAEGIRKLEEGAA